MASLAVRVRPPIVLIVALFGLVLIAGLTPQTGPESQLREEHALPWPGATTHEVPPEASTLSLLDRAVGCHDWREMNAVPPPEWRDRDGGCPPEQQPTDARPWNLGGMVMGLPETNDRIAHNALTDLLSGLFDVVRSLRV